jgi:hypothetical protein
VITIDHYMIEVFESSLNVLHSIFLSMISLIYCTEPKFEDKTSGSSIDGKIYFRKQSLTEEVKP